MILMYIAGSSSIHNSKKRLALFALLAVALLAPCAMSAKTKKKDETNKPAPVIDYSNIVWPNPPAIARIKYQAFYSAQALSQVQTVATSKSKWMDRLAGTTPTSEEKMLFQLAQPLGLAVDSKGKVYVADEKVGAIFIFNTETREAEMIKNKVEAHFVRIIGLAMDDDDRLFVSDAALHHVLVFNAAHKAENIITEGLVSPGSMALDRENRILYVSDVELDQVLAYDADSLKLLRKMGTTGHKHELTTPGDFAKPTGLAVDKDGNLYVADTLNDRIEIFDADGNFVKTFGKNGDGPGAFARPKGVTIDSDGNIWVTDGALDRVQVFNQDLQLLIIMGGHGLLPGQFQGLVGIYADKNNRIFTSEIYPGRVQQFRYVTEAEFEAQKKLREEKGAHKHSSAAEQKPAGAVTPKEVEPTAKK
jgi:sugar lactone lactonase YvrE